MPRDVGPWNPPANARMVVWGVERSFVARRIVVEVRLLIVNGGYWMMMIRLVFLVGGVYCVCRVVFGVSLVA